MASGQSSKPGKRKRSVSDVEDIENSVAWTSDRSEHQRKRLRGSPCPASPPLTPLHPLSPHNQCLTPDSSPCRRRSTDSPGSSQRNLMPSLSWLNRNGMVDLMSQKDSQSNINPDVFAKHCNLQPRMRAVLLDWLMEVCDAYKMHRATFYLSINYLDRYLSCTTNIAKTQLQLIGITSLFIASKVEEIYPPKAHEFAYVTNEACTTDEILSMELLILDKLEWNISTLTVNTWLSLLLQLWHNREAAPKAIQFPNHPVKDYLQSAQLLDLIMLDEGCLRFPYLALAAAAIHVMTDFKDVINCPPVASTDREREIMADCVMWMSPFAETLRERGSPRKPGPPVDYTIQTHHEDLTLLENTQTRLKNLQYSSVVMTPPPSSEKTLA